MNQPQSPDEEAASASALPESTEPGTAAKPVRRHRPLWLRTLRNLACIYIIWCVVACNIENYMLFPRDVAPQPLPRPYDKTTEVLSLDLDGGGQVVAFFLPALPIDPSAPAPLVVFFHGNAELIDYQDNYIEGYRKLGCAVLLPEYRGYGRSAGQPSEVVIVADAERFYDLAIKRPDVDPARVVFHGRSLGGGPAALLAARRPPKVLILESTFTSVGAMAWKFLVPSCIVKNKFDVAGTLAKLEIPTLIFHGTRDDIIPVAHGRKLAETARHGKYVEYNCKHNDFPGEGHEEAYWTEVAAFLRTNQIIPRKAAWNEERKPTSEPALTTRPTDSASPSSPPDAGGSKGTAP